MLRRFLYLPPPWTRHSEKNYVPTFDVHAYLPSDEKKREGSLRDADLHELSLAVSEISEDGLKAHSESLEGIVQQQAITFDPSVLNLHEKAHESFSRHNLYKASTLDGGLSYFQTIA